MVPVLGPEPMSSPGSRTRELQRLVTIKKVELTSVLTAIALLGGFAVWVISEARRESDTNKSDVVELKQDVKSIGHRIDRVVEQNAKAQLETQLDIRAMSQQLVSGQRPRRLNRPPEPVPP